MPDTTIVLKGLVVGASAAESDFVNPKAPIAGVVSVGIVGRFAEFAPSGREPDVKVRGAASPGSLPS